MIKLCDKKDCTGCSSCYNVCVHQALSMQPDKEGFLYPVIDVDKCKECSLCEKACPVLNEDKLYDNDPAPSTYALCAEDSICQRSSSGGAFSLLAMLFINRGGVVFGAAINSNNEVYHTSITSIDELDKLRGSKYVQSTLGYSYREVREILQKGRLVLFTGTPCQIAGLKRFLRKPYPNLFLVDIFCHGVPSPLFLHKTSSILSDRGYDVTKSLIFRDTKTWKCQQSYGNHVVKYNSPDDIYLQSFLKGLNFRESCYRCPFAALPRQGDISIGDFWGIGRWKLFGHDTTHGVSCILINNSKGIELWQDIQKEAYCEALSLKEAKLANPNIFRASRRPNLRDTFYEDFDNMHLDDFLRKYKVFHKPFSVRNYVSKWIDVFHLRSAFNKLKMLIYK